MGFSVSGSAAIVFAGMFIGFSIFYGATSNSFERVTEAQAGQTDAVVDQKNVDVEIVKYEESDGDYTISINNTGSKELSVSKTDLLVDNEYITGWESSATVTDTAGNEDGDTDVWAPGEQLEITINTDPGRVKIITEYGVSDTVDVSGETKVLF